jgi:hypothetical protein
MRRRIRTSESAVYPCDAQTPAAMAARLRPGFADRVQPVGQHPAVRARLGRSHTPPDNLWTIATLIDAYFGILTFYVWVLWKKTRSGARVLWFLAIMLLGNIAMSAYVLRQLHRLGPNEPPGSLLAARNP